MLQKNHLRPPRPSRTTLGAAPRRGPNAGRRRTFTSAEDFDATGILAGMDPCESRYWWVPELAVGGDLDGRDQAASPPRSAADA